LRRQRVSVAFARCLDLLVQAFDCALSITRDSQGLWYAGRDRGQEAFAVGPARGGDLCRKRQRGRRGSGGGSGPGGL